MSDGLITIIVAALSGGLLTEVVRWLFSRRKERVDTLQAEIAAMQGIINTWKKEVKDLEILVSEYREENKLLKKQVENLTEQVKRLRKQ